MSLIFLRQSTTCAGLLLEFPGSGSKALPASRASTSAESRIMFFFARMGTEAKRKMYHHQHGGQCQQEWKRFTNPRKHDLGFSAFHHLEERDVFCPVGRIALRDLRAANISCGARG